VTARCRRHQTLTGRRILVTGASSGIGEASCRALVTHGANVAMLALRAERLDDFRIQLGERAAGKGIRVEQATFEGIVMSRPFSPL
jgi:NADP-dependent 3-hydroxy acid dehydrogenase YdfG